MLRVESLITVERDLHLSAGLNDQVNILPSLAVVNGS